MNLPQIVFQTSTRWFVVSKPSGWALAARASDSQPSIERYLSPIIGSNKLYFPIEMDSRMRALAVVCTDRGLQAQFEKFKQMGLIKSTYHVGLDCACKDIGTTSLPSGMRLTCVDADGDAGLMEVDKPVTISKLNGALAGRLRNNHINLFRLVFPDPLNPKGGQDLTIEAPYA